MILCKCSYYKHVQKYVSQSLQKQSRKYHGLTPILTQQCGGGLHKHYIYCVDISQNRTDCKTMCNSMCWTQNMSNKRTLPHHNWKPEPVVQTIPLVLWLTQSCLCQQAHKDFPQDPSSWPGSESGSIYQSVVYVPV